jgi:hypothetical protein
MTSVTGRAKTSAAEFGERYPRPAQPSAAQWWLPGIE